MNLITIFCLIILATSKVTLQGVYARKYISDLSGSVYFNGIIFLFSSLIFIHSLKCSLTTVLFGFAFGILTVLFQLCYIQAMSAGNVSFTVLTVNSSMILPILFSAIFFDETFEQLRVFGILTIAFSLVLSAEKSFKKAKRKWFCLSACAFLFNGCLSICQQIFGKSAYKDEAAAFVAYSYVFAAIISFMLYFTLKLKKKRKAFKPSRSTVIYGMSAGIVLGIFQLVNTRAISTIDAGLLFPVYNGGTLIMSALTGVLLFKDTLKPKQILSVIVGIFGIVLINL